MIGNTRSAWLLVAFCATGSWANVSPDTPLVTEPSLDGQIVSAADVHMETGLFSDPDPGDAHLCTDWEIWTIAPVERVWITACIGGVEAVHTHLGDGVFEGSHSGRSELLADTDYRLRVRHRDDSGDPGTEWSAFAERIFRTGPLSEVFPLDLLDVSATPGPVWVDAQGQDIILPGTPTPAYLRLESASGSLLLECRGLDGNSNLLTNPSPLAAHVAVRVQVFGGDAGELALPAGTLAFTDGDGVDRSLYLPAMAVPASQSAYFWVSANGSTYFGDASEFTPNFANLARGAPVPWAVLQPGYQVEVMATGFQLPVNIAFVPDPGPNPNDPSYYVAELYGTIKVVTRGGTVSDFASGLLNFNPTGQFPGSGEQGLAGIAVDPATGDVFATLLYDAAPPAGPHFPKVVRFTSLDGGLTADTQTTILNMAGEPQGQSHQISNASFGPDGRLYVHVGDGFDASTAQNLNSYRGKILRLNLDGSPAVGNPFYNLGNGINSADYVFAYGVRNPFGGARRAADGFHYCVENGPSVDRFARIVAGRNYLWDGTDASMFNFALYNWDPAHAPVNLAFIEPQTFGGSGFPPQKMDHAFVAESGPTWASGPQTRGKRITEFVIDGGGNLVGGPTTLIEYNGSGKATAVALAAGPDGIYFTDFYKDVNFVSPIDRGSSVLRVKFVGSADFTADLTSGASPLAVQFTDASSVPSPSAWLWSFGDGATSTTQHPAHTYVAEGVYDVRLRVTGSNGVSVRQRNGYIRIGVFPTIAMIGGTASPNASDAAAADHLRGFGFTVDHFDDDRPNRPTAAQLAASYDLVIVSSTTTSANVAGDFRNESVPLLYWEQALGRNAREPLADNGLVTGGTTAIDLLNNTHPVTVALPLGAVDVYAPPANMSLALDPIAPGVTVLATRAGAPGERAIMVAEAGAALLSGHVAPARRVFLFFEDNTWVSTTAAARQIFEQAVHWALGRPFPSVRPDLDRDRDVDLADWSALRGCLTGPTGSVSGGCAAADFDVDQDADLMEIAKLQRCFSGQGAIAALTCDD